MYTPPTVASYKIVTDAGIPFYTPGNSDPSLTNPFNKLVFQPNMTLDDMANPIIKLALSMKAKKIMFVQEENDYGEITFNSTKERQTLV